MADFTFTVDSDFSKVFADLAKVSQGARQAGDTLGKGLSDGLATANANISALSAQIKTLITTRSKLQVDSSEYRSVQQQIDTLQGKLAQARGEKLKLQADASAVTAAATEIGKLGPAAQRAGGEVSKGIGDPLTALQGRLQELQQRQVKVNVNSQEFKDLQREINTVQRELQNVERNKIDISVNTNSITAITGRLQAELNKLQERQVKVDVDSTEFAALGREIDRVQGELQQVERRRLLINADPSSIVALRARLGDLQGELDKTQIGSRRFRELQAEIKGVQSKLGEAGQEAKGFGSALSAIQSIPFLAGFASLTGVIGLLKGAIDQAVQLETITRKLSNTLGQQGAAGALAFTKGLANELGLSFTTLSNTFGSFTAAATSAGVPIKQQQELFAAVSKSAQSLGLSNDELSGSLLALQQVASKGTVQMEELRGQLGERLPIAFNATARGLGITQQELIKLVEGGKLTADRFFPALTKGLNELTAGSGGVATAAQNFQKLSNAWAELQTSLGQNILPSVTASVQALTGALEGLKVDISAKELRTSFGVTANEATQLVGVLGNIQKQYGLTWQQAKNLLSVAIANTGASRDWFGELNLGGKRFSQVQLGLIDLARKFRAENPDLTAQKNEEAAAAQKVAQQLLKNLDIEKARKAANQELNKVIGESQVQALASQISTGQALLSLAQAIGQAEQSRYGVTRSALNFELQKAQERNASETQIKGIKDQIAANDRAALAARYQALKTEQALQQAMLALTQEKARSEANLAVLQQRAEILKAQAAVDDARKKNDAVAEAKALGDLKIQQQILSIKQSAVDLLGQTQPLELAALGYQQEAARNGLQSEAAAIGYRIALDGSLQKASLFAQLQGRIGSITTSNAAEQERYTRLAEQSGIAVGKAADGTVVLGRTQADVNKAVAEMNKQISSSKGSFDAAGKGAAGVEGAVDGIRTGLGNAQNPANALAGAFAKTGDRAPAIAQGSRDFAAYLSKAGGFTTAIANLNLDRRMATVASSTRDAATAAQTFYSALKNAAALPGSRWTGGPVEAGGEYRINELGQEAFLSAGRLSLINAPANSIWRAPSEGVVIPAGITARLQAQGAMQPAGGSAVGTAELAIEVGKLRQEVGNLARRDWSVRVTQRTGPTGSQVMRTLLS